MELNVSKHGMKSAAKRDLIEHHAHGAADSESVQDLAGRDPADSRPLAGASNAGGTARSHPFSRRLLRLFGLSSAVSWYGGWPFLKGIFEELKSCRPGMMTLISIAIATAYLYSSAVVLACRQDVVLGTGPLIDIMLLEHWIEMKSLMGAGRRADVREHGDCGHQCTTTQIEEMTCRANRILARPSMINSEVGQPQ